VRLAYQEVEVTSGDGSIKIGNKGVPHRLSLTFKELNT